MILGLFFSLVVFLFVSFFFSSRRRHTRSPGDWSSDVCSSDLHQTQWSAERPLPPPVSLTSQSHHEKPPEVTCTSRGNPGFPASTRESPRETFFNTSRGQIPLPWLGSNDALPLATRMETRLPWRPTRGSLTSPSYLVRNRTLGPPLENNPEIPPSSRDEGLRLLHGLETNLATSLQTPQEA